MTVKPVADRRGNLHFSLWRGIGRVGQVLLPFVLLVLVWQLAVTLSGLSSFLFPAPLDVVDAFYDLSRKGLLTAYTVDSLGRWLVGSVTGVAVGVVLALALAFSKPLRELLMPVVRFFTAIAELAWLPLVILWFQFGFTTIVVIIWYTVVFPVLYNLLSGIENIPQTTRDAVRSMGANRWQVVREVLLPGSLPSLMAGFRAGAGYAFRALVAVEILAANSGLGYMIFESRSTAQTDRIIVGMIILGLLWLAINRLYLAPLESATVERWGFGSKE